jgi:hypothetical protein
MLCLCLSLFTPTFERKDINQKGVVVNIHGVAVQFLPVYNPLNEEAVQQARNLAIKVCKCG